MKRVSSRGIIIEDNYVYVMFRRKIAIEDLDKVDILSTDMIRKAYNKEYSKHI